MTPEAAQALGYSVPVFRALRAIGGARHAAQALGISEANMSRYQSGVLPLPDRLVLPFIALAAQAGHAVTADEIQRANRRVAAARLLRRAEQLLAESAAP